MNSCLSCGKDCARKFCSRLCSATVNSAKRKKKRPECQNCGKETTHMVSRHCSHECHLATIYTAFIERWKRGEESGVVGFTETSRHIRRYLRETRGNKCQKCGWCEVNPASGNVPIQLEHIDGNWRNNVEENLCLLCPNCHSLTPTFGGLNRGHGRKERYKVSASLM